MFIIACQKPGPSEAAGTRPARSAAIPEPGYRPSLLVPRSLVDALERVRSLAGANLQVLELRIYPDRLLVQARDPRRADRVLEYQYHNGLVSRPVEVRLIGPGRLEDNLFSLEEVRLEAVPELARRATELVDGLGGQVSYLLVRRNLPTSWDVQFRVYVKSPLKDGYVDADAEGRVLESERTSGSGREPGSARTR